MPDRFRAVKRFALFCFPSFYPGGGWSDFVDSFESISEALQSQEAKASEHIQIIDLQTGEEISKVEADQPINFEALSRRLGNILLNESVQTHGQLRDFLATGKSFKAATTKAWHYQGPGLGKVTRKEAQSYLKNPAAVGRRLTPAVITAISRRQEMYRMRLANRTLGEIGRRFGIGREAVRQHLLKAEEDIRVGRVATK